MISKKDLKNLTATQLTMAMILNRINGKRSALEFIEFCNKKDN